MIFILPFFLPWAAASQGAVSRRPLGAHIYALSFALFLFTFCWMRQLLQVDLSLAVYIFDLNFSITLSLSLTHSLTPLHTHTLKRTLVYFSPLSLPFSSPRFLFFFLGIATVHGFHDLFILLVINKVCTLHCASTDLLILSYFLFFGGLLLLLLLLSFSPIYIMFIIGGPVFF